MRNGLIIDQFGAKRWYKNNLLHRTDGPAVIWADSYKAWYFEGKYHRTDGPAFIGADGSEAWYLNDKQLTHEEWLAAVSSYVSIPSSVPTNDYTCPTCKNDRCSKTEKSCWKCGSKL
jgi:hypothetical protein